MADTKISAATAVVTPAATDEYPTNQGGVSKKTTRAQMHALESGEVLLFDGSESNTVPTIAINGKSGYGFGETYANRLGIIINGTQVCQWQAGNVIAAANGSGPVLKNIAAGGTNVTLVPNANDTNTGLGASSADNVSLIAGGLEAIRAEDPADLAATETSLWLYDLDNGAIQQVTVGAADSGGSGFKVLRIPN